MRSKTKKRFNGAAVKAWRKSQEMSQHEMATQLWREGCTNVQAQHIAHWERGRIPRADILLVIAKMMKMSPDKLILTVSEKAQDGSETEKGPKAA